MAEEKKLRALFEGMKRRVSAEADALKMSAATVLRVKTAEIREAIGPQKTLAAKQPERPFGRDEHGADVKQVVWTGHTIKTPEGQAYFGAAGLTDNGYYRAAEVQVYGSDEAWRWQQERHTSKEAAVGNAEHMSATRLAEFKKGRSTMADVPENLKAEAAKIMAATRETTAKIPVEAKSPNAPQQREGAALAQEKIAQMARSGKDADTITKAASKDDFARH